MSRYFNPEFLELYHLVYDISPASLQQRFQNLLFGNEAIHRRVGQTYSMYKTLANNRFFGRFFDRQGGYSG